MPLAVFTSVTVTGTCCLCSPLAPAAPSSVHIFHCDFGTWCPWHVHICQDSLWTWHLLHLAVFTSGTRCSWRYSHLLLWLAPAAPSSVHTGLYDWHQMPMPFTTFHWLCYCLCSLLQLLMLLTACVVLCVAQRWTNQKVCNSHLTSIKLMCAYATF